MSLTHWHTLTPPPASLEKAKGEVKKWRARVQGNRDAKEGK
jgi:hypothetical protein